VVEGAEKVKVALASGEKEFEAKIIGTDPPTDVAVLKIETKGDLPAIIIADSDKLEVGDTVLAIGNPFGVGQTVTLGIASAVGRGGFGINDYENFIQTDAAINQGNSGGALVDAEGRLVGINTAILSRTGGNMGVGFAVPINMARFVMDRIIQDGKVSRGYLGVNIQPLTPDLAKAFNLPDESSGVLVGGVSPRSAADRAGLKDGDVITEYNGKKVTDRRNLQLAVAQTPPRTKVNLHLLRTEGQGKPVDKNIAVTLDELPQETVASGHSGNAQREPGPSSLDALDGVEVTELDNRVRRELDIPNTIRGAMVASVDENSNAGEAGLRPGDVIVEIDRQPVGNADAAVHFSEKAKGKQILLRVWSARGGSPGSTRFIVVNNSKSNEQHP
jgi:serine protease Do